MSYIIGDGSDPTKLYVGNLSYLMTNELIRKAFSPFGKILYAEVAIAPESGRFRGFARVQMSTVAEADKARTTLDNTDVEGRVILVAIDGPEWPT